MANLKAEFQALGYQATQTLDQIHDDYDHTRKLWLLLQVRVTRYKEHFEFRNRVTQTRVTAAQLAASAGGSIRRHSERTFKEIISQFELFFADVLLLWLVNHPRLLEEKALDVGTLLNSKSLADAQHAAIREAAESTVLKKAYGKPADWMRYINRLFGATVIADGDGDQFAEMKASRDLLEHARGMVNATYQEKSGAAARFRVGDTVSITPEYHTETFELVRKMVSHVTLAASNAAN